MTATPEGHVDDVGCWCGPAVHPVAGLMHTLTAPAPSDAEKDAITPEDYRDEVPS